MSLFKPMLAGKSNEAIIEFPVLASVKIDGVRAIVNLNKLVSRTLKPFPNELIQSLLSHSYLDGADGELVLGDPRDKDVYRKTNQALSTIKAAPSLTFYIFDNIYHAGTFSERLHYNETHFNPQHVPLISGITITPLKHHVISNLEELLEFERVALADGYEGIILRDPQAKYKYGRSTSIEGGMIKVKRYEDMEAVIVGVEEEMHNANPSMVNELGRTHRSTQIAGKTGKGTMGALVVKGLNGPFAGAVFNVGTGFSADDRKALWPLGTIIRVKYFNVGVKDKPRHPVFLGKRMAEDTL